MRRRSAAGACRSRESSGTANDAAMRVAGQGPGWHFDPRRHPRGVLAALPIEASDTHNAAVASPGARPMHTLYYSPGAASMVVHWLLIELAIPHQLSLVDFESRAQKSPAYLELNPHGVVPTLVIDGRPHAEAAALLVHRADTPPEARLSPPESGREACRERGCQYGENSA